MKKRLFLAVMRPGMKFYAQHGPWREMTEGEFLALEDVQQVVKNAKSFGGKVRLMEDDPDPSKPNKVVLELP